MKYKRHKEQVNDHDKNIDVNSRSQNNNYEDYDENEDVKWR